MEAQHYSTDSNSESSYDGFSGNMHVEEGTGHLSSFFRELGVTIHDLQVVKLLSVLQDLCFQTVQLALVGQTLLLK